MRRLPLLLLAGALHLCASPLFAQAPDGGGIVYGSNYSFLIQAPPGWAIDNQAGRPNGLEVVFYPTGESWEHGAAVMYVNTAPPDSGHDADPLLIIAQDSARFVSAAPTVRIVGAPSLQTTDHRIAYVRYFSGQPNGRYEAVAYVTERAVTPMIVLTAKTEAAFTAALPSFSQLVASYSFLSSDVHIKHRPSRVNSRTDR
jgi:hypothetical protein